ncbi:hypothetical protein BSY16_5126 (plasmid) [Sinorhizobium sp. RAC02]|nr:hypothetical protein BSY16_5126 [Sinorhizobium sp. RAC02]
MRQRNNVFVEPLWRSINRRRSIPLLRQNRVRGSGGQRPLSNPLQDPNNRSPHSFLDRQASARAYFNATPPILPAAETRRNFTSERPKLLKHAEPPFISCRNCIARRTLYIKATQYSQASTCILTHRPVALKHEIGDVPATLKIKTLPKSDGKSVRVSANPQTQMTLQCVTGFRTSGRIDFDLRFTCRRLSFVHGKESHLGNLEPLHQESYNTL